MKTSMVGLGVSKEVKEFDSNTIVNTTDDPLKLDSKARVPLKETAFETGTE